jgi:pimeloyl-ACP methyl ester carboxylesterase
MEVDRALAVGGVALHYRLSRSGGSRPPLVLLHGVASNLTRWSEFVEQTTLKASRDLVRVDLRGQGGSLTRTRIGMERWSDDLVAILDAEGYSQAVLVGHSLGANLSVHFAHRHPSRVAGLGLIDPVLLEALHGRARLVGRIAPLARPLIAALLRLNRLGLHRRRVRPLDLRALDEATRKKVLATGRPDALLRRYGSPFADVRFVPTATYLQDVVELVRPLPPLAEIGAPVLALLSTGITFTDLEETARLLRALPRVEIEHIDAYHWPLTEKPADVRAAIERWCVGLPAGRA